MSDNSIERAWAAGFMDGEGTFGAYRRNADKYPSDAIYRLKVQAAQSHREPLDRLQAALGGKVYGPYGPYTTQKTPYYLWMAEGDRAREVIDSLTPFMCSIKTEQAGSALEAAA